MRTLFLCVGASAASVRLVAQCPNGAPPPCAGAGSTHGPTSVAVLPFSTLSRDSADALLAEGITGEITNSLNHVPRLFVASYAIVKSRRGVANPVAMARALGVAWLVTGTMQRAGQQLRFTVELADPASGRRAWGDVYQRGDGDIFAVQADIARHVAEAVAGRLLPTERTALAARPTENNAAYDHLLRGNAMLARRGLDGITRAVAEYRSALALDSLLVPAWARIGLAYAIWMESGSTADGRPVVDSLLRVALAAESRALALDSSSSEAWLAHGYVMKAQHPQTYEGVESAFRRAIALNPRNAEAYQQLADALGEMTQNNDTLRALYRQVLAIDPGRAISLRNLGGNLLGVEGLRYLDSALAIDPTLDLAHQMRALARADRGDTAGAREDYAAEAQLLPPDQWAVRESRLAHLLYHVGDRDGSTARARALFARLSAAGPLSQAVGDELARALFHAGDSTAQIAVLLRIRPRGVWFWNTLTPEMRDGRWGPALKAAADEARPPWAR